ncbi:hypothetical protein [Succinimonas sp.]|uniref:hypothetical protein n=1 Tax=Succinimonas sp. TaxID=1936151 RepID=UPI00386B241F
MEYSLHDCFKVWVHDDFSCARLCYEEQPVLYEKRRSTGFQKLEPFIARIRTGGDEARKAIWKSEYRTGISVLGKRFFSETAAG